MRRGKNLGVHFSHINEFRFMGKVSMVTNNQNSHNQQQQSRNQVYSKTTIEPNNKQGKESREKRTTHQEIFTQFGPTITNSEREFDFSNPV